MGISFSSTTTTTTTATTRTTARRATTTPTPPYPLTHPTFLDYYPPYPAPFPAYGYPAFYGSNAYSMCNQADPFVGQPCFAPLELQQVVRGVPPPLQLPSSGGDEDNKAAKVVSSEVNVHRDSMRIEVDELNPDRHLVSFVFDALLDGSFTICYFAKEQNHRRVVSLFPETYVPIKVPFRKGLRQEFRQPSGTGIDFRFFATEDLSHPSLRDHVYPIVISAETYPSDFIVDDRNYFLPRELPQVQISQVVVGKDSDGQFTAKVVRQLLWTENICYELREIYGLGKSSSGINGNGAGKECVVCLTEPKDVAVLPCRHMCMCSDCAKELRLQSNKCPICREIIEALLEIKMDQ